MPLTMSYCFVSDPTYVSLSANRILGITPNQGFSLSTYSKIKCTMVVNKDNARLDMEINEMSGSHLIKRLEYDHFT